MPPKVVTYTEYDVGALQHMLNEKADKILSDALTEAFNRLRLTIPEDVMDKIRVQVGESSMDAYFVMHELRQQAFKLLQPTYRHHTLNEFLRRNPLP